ncbi:MAG TPA: hypothetical protein VL625_05105, partial [Patescibacteria group bacterium]|nr:hypothetical protein [Patescibacteria group bacterium]
RCEILFIRDTNAAAVASLLLRAPAQDTAGTTTNLGTKDRPAYCAKGFRNGCARRILREWFCAFIRRKGGMAATARYMS